MGRFSPNDCRRHIWLTEGCLPSINLLEKGQAEAASE